MFGGGGGGIGMMGTGYPYSTGMYPTYGAGYAGGLGMAGSVAQQPVLGTATQQQQQAGTNAAATPPKELHPQINLTTIIRFLTESAAVFEGLRMVLQVIRSWGSEVLGFGQTGPLAGVRNSIVRFLRRVLEWFVPRLRVAREGRELQQAWEGKSASTSGTSWLAYLFGGYVLFSLFTEYRQYQQIKRIIREGRKPRRPKEAGGESDVEELLELYKRKQREMYRRKHGNNEGVIILAALPFGIVSMIEEDVDLSMKVIVVGNGQVGKTSMITRFARGVFTQEYKKTLAVDFLEKRLWIEPAGEELTFFLWDTAGQEEYDAITRGYYKGAGAAIIAFSTVDRASFEAVESWYKKIVEECGQIVMLLVQNKVDLIDQAVVTAQEAESLSRKLRIPLYRTCVSANLNIDNAFLALGERFLAKGGHRYHQSVRHMSEYSTVSANSKGAAGGLDSASVDTHHTSSVMAANPPRGFQIGASGKTPSVQRTNGKKHPFASCSCT
ncbi:Ras- protein Rab-23 [Perkinsus olseni]|uniref:Ras- protein Rab-23 n=1 Tax=Perkinsus olseni TaxID=32597 RepID=A0A7J6SS68_PEROL|nr:Ras- protein Rab-23 [Perkinsus olseni]